MKKISLIASLLISAALFAQPPLKDSTAKKDTVRVPYLVREATDTIPALVVYCGKEPAVKYSYGFTIMKGMKDQNGTYIDQPKPSGWLDKNGKPITTAVLMWYYDDKRKKEVKR